ncbi:MAG: hypothetical protein Q7S72_00365 [Candidatus Taylorbacteria bacterium]|nr:hypothetical protein [Candidatus Taylorbacteria bacterium]
MPPQEPLTNKKLIETVKIFVVYGCIFWATNLVMTFIFASLSSFLGFSPWPNIWTSGIGLIVDVIALVICGVIFYFLYNPVHDWIKRNGFLSKHIYNMFTLLWKPALVVFIVDFMFALIGLGLFFLGNAIIMLVQLVIYYFYSKFIAKKLTPLYPW